MSERPEPGTTRAGPHQASVVPAWWKYVLMMNGRLRAGRKEPRGALSLEEAAYRGERFVDGYDVELRLLVVGAFFAAGRLRVAAFVAAGRLRVAAFVAGRLRVAAFVAAGRLRVKAFVAAGRLRVAAFVAGRLRVAAF